MRAISPICSEPFIQLFKLNLHNGRFKMKAYNPAKDLTNGLENTTVCTAEDMAYNNAVEKYVEMFGYEPNFVCLPEPTIAEILNAVETGIELYIEESNQTDYLL